MNTIENFKEILRYLFVGILTTVVSLGCYYLCMSFFFNPENPIQLQIANIISWIAAVTFAYFASREYVFMSNNTKHFKEMLLFYSARITTLLIDMGIMFVGVTIMHGNHKIVKIVVQIIVTVSNYIFSKIIVFNNK